MDNQNEIVESAEAVELENVDQVNEQEESVVSVDLAGEEEAEVEIDGPELTEDEAVAAVEAILFAFGDPLPLSKLVEVTGFDLEVIKNAVESLEMKYEHEESGVELFRVGNDVQIRTKAIFARCIQKLKAGRPKKLSPAALETLAVIAYRQPVVRADIEKIRGVDPSPTIKTLLERKLVKIVGHQASIGQPALYGTTDEFMKLFGLTTLSELPSLRDIKEFMEEPGEAGEDELEDSLEAEDGAVDSEEIQAVV